MNNWYLLAAIPVFGLLVFVHEFGHFITAKWAGMRVEEFSLGFPPRLFGVRRRVSGGWEVVWFSGKKNEDQEFDPNGSQSPLLGTSGGGSISKDADDHTLYSLSLLPIGGFVRMTGEMGETDDEQGHYDPKSFASKSAGWRVTVLSAGVIMNLIMACLLFTISYSLGEPVRPAVVSQVEAGSPAALAGLKASDKVISVNGQAIKSFTEMQMLVNQEVSRNTSKQTVPVTMQILHQGQSQPQTTVVQARVHPPQGKGPLGVTATSQVVYNKYPLWQAPLKGLQYTFETTRDFIQSLVQMVTGQIQPQLAGPVGIVKVTGEVAQTVPTIGWFPILNLTGLLSLNLAIVNILPFPALDGGRIFLILIELLRGGKRLKPEQEGVINLVGMALLLTLMVVITTSDIMHWGQ